MHGSIVIIWIVLFCTGFLFYINGLKNFRFEIFNPPSIFKFLRISLNKIII